MLPYFTVESNVRTTTVTFEVLQLRLLAFVNLQIKRGEYTERGLARILGVSQPQLHNVLKGARALHSGLADRLLRRFGISALELLTAAELAIAAGFRNEPKAPQMSPDEEAPHRWRKPAASGARLGRQRAS